MRALALLTVLIVGGCGPFAGLTTEERAALTPETIVFAVKSDLRDKQLVFNTYAIQPFCTPEILTACADPRVVIAGQTALDTANEAVLDAERAVRAGLEPTNISLALSAAQAGLNTVAALLATEGIQEWK